MSRTVTLPDEIATLAEWIVRKMETEDYGEIATVIKLHAGRPALLEKTFTEKIQITGYTGGQHEHSKR